MARSVLVLGALVSLLTPLVSATVDAGTRTGKLDLALQRRITDAHGSARVIVRATDLSEVETMVAAAGGRIGRRLAGINAVVAEIPVRSLVDIARLPCVLRVSLDRQIEGTLARTAAALGARWVTERLGFDGTGIGGAIIDSGVARTHDDLNGNRVVQFVDFVDYRTQPHDGYGHGTHVAG